MANIDYSQIKIGSNNENSIGFFGLKNDQDEAIVRIMHDSVESFDIVTTHPIQINGKYRRLNCIRDPREPIENCPVCAAGDKIQQRIYIHLINYTRDDDGNIVGKPCVWERSVSYARTLAGLINDYGPLSDCIFKIRREGASGDLKTTYAITYCRPEVYNPNVYVKPENAFDGYRAVGNVVFDKNFDELVYYVTTGSLDMPNQNAQSVPTVTPINNATMQYTPPVQNTADVPWEQNNVTTPIQRPIRRY